ncbi:SidA/IucD/PvdA family monooxygenase [Paenibacillus sp. LMG 31456]|uniref:SidA/IucD/PvdA family monooxygenase n=2 Tax=Paenibacillus foliorum TaxID=2654974 RepID=A0A972GQ82_9BACL|nr:NAD(P)-binding domain-containing protein [Paenibacillus foliorum]NOU92399.1 SidA/IucD/PvdA family monooxygenase [Paenibacillus foliorum]
MDYEVIIIGGGQSGLSTGYFLRKYNTEFMILDANNQIGDSWRNRYDSLTLFSPRAYSSLQGMPMPGEAEGYPNKDEVADYLESYAMAFSLPIRTKTLVTGLSKIYNGFRIHTNRDTYTAKNIIIAAGPFQTPFIPETAKALHADIYQVHSSQYKNPLQLQEGPVLVVGGGNSGTQIAAECSLSRQVILSVSKPLRFIPNRLLGKSIFSWFDILGLSQATSDSFIGRRLRQNEPIIGTELKPYLLNGSVRVKPATVRFGPEEVYFEDGSHLPVRNIIWATGFRCDYSWISIPGVVDVAGRPIHKRGVSPILGLYFVGLPWQHRRGSALIGGVGIDSEWIVEQLTWKHELSH